LITMSVTTSASSSTAVMMWSWATKASWSKAAASPWTAPRTPEGKSSTKGWRRRGGRVLGTVVRRPKESWTFRLVIYTCSILIECSYEIPEWDLLIIVCHDCCLLYILVDCEFV
jgi:hypothetical protein